MARSIPPRVPLAGRALASIAWALPLVSSGACTGPAWQPDPVGDLDEALGIRGGEATPWPGSDIGPITRSVAAPRARPPVFAAGAPHVHYLNFCDGSTTLKHGTDDDAPHDVSQLCGHTSAGCVPYDGSDADRKDFIARIHAVLLPFNIVVVSQRPKSGTYSMELLSPQGNGCVAEPGVGGWAPADCGDENHQSVSLTFFTSGAAGTPGWVITAQESAHAFGLSHVDTACDVMGSGYSGKGCPGGKWGYPDTTGKVIPDAICPGQTTQNSYQMMLDALGPWPAGVPKPDPDATACEDEEAPVARITEPVDGAKVGASFEVRAEATDDCAPTGKAHISVPDLALEADSSAPPYQWDLTGIRAGAHEIAVEIWDGSGKSSRTEVTVHVDGGNGGGGRGGQGGGGGGAGGHSAGPTSVSGGCAVGPSGPRGAGAASLSGLFLVAGWRLLRLRRSVIGSTFRECPAAPGSRPDGAARAAGSLQLPGA